MKNPFPSFLVVLVLTCALSGCGQSIWKTAGPRVGPLRDDREKLSYAIGLSIGEEWKKGKRDVDPQAAVRGMDDGFAGNVSGDGAKELTRQLALVQQASQAAHNGNALPGATLPPRDRVSYAMGVNLGMAWRSLHMDIDPGSVDRGLNDFLSGGALQISPDDAKTVVADYGQKFAAQQAEARRQLGEKNKAEAAAFLAGNKTKPGVVELPTGLQYKVLASGSGDSPDYYGWAYVRYRGTLLDGTEVENSSRYGDPFAVSPRTVNEGMSEALQMMKPGAKWEIYVPARLAYGEEGGVGVGPNAALIYQLELISVLPGIPQLTAAQAKEMNKD